MNVSTLIKISLISRYDSRALLWTIASGLAFQPLLAEEGRPLPQPAFRADDLVEMVGICNGPLIAVTDGKGYSNRYFDDLGIRHYRMILHYARTPADQPEQVLALWEKSGARPTMLIDPHKTPTAESILEKLKLYAAGLIEAVEGPNECNNKFLPQELNLRYKGKTDEAAGAAFMDDVYRAIKGDPATKNIDVIAYTAIFTPYSLARPHEAFDFANMHSYQGYDVPSSSLLPNMAAAWNLLPPGASIKPFMPTECGYNVEVDKSNGTLKTGSRRAQALNIPMLVAEYFRHGIARAYLFSMTNVDGYGLLENDMATKRPAYAALKGLLDELRDAVWSVESKQWNCPTFSPRALLFTMDGIPVSLHTLTLQKQDGSYRLLIWNEVKNFDQRGKKDLYPKPIPATLRFSMPIAPDIELLTQNDEGEWTATPIEAQGQTLSLNVPSSVAILRLKTLESQSVAVPEPVNVTGIATENSIQIHWEAPQGGADVGGYFIYRNGAHIATKTGATSFSDSSTWVRPGLGYTYAVQAYGKSGHLSARREIQVQTPNRRPDLQAIDLLVEPPNPKPGDSVRFKAVVKNVGEGATPSGVGISVAFFVNGQRVNWGSARKPLEPGESVTIEASGGPQGAALWPAVSGAHVVRLKLDDQGRIPGEENKFNNDFDRSLWIDVPGSDYFAAQSEAAPLSVDLRTEGTLDWVAWGDGNSNALARKEPLSSFRERLLRAFFGGKPNGNLISALTEIPGGIISSPSVQNRGISLVWNDGNPGKEQAATPGLAWNGVGSGYSFTVPADVKTKVLRVYVGGSEGAKGKFTAQLSDGSTPAYISETWDGNLGRSNGSPFPGYFSARYTVRYRAAQSGQEIKMTWTLANEPNRNLGQLRLLAATLAEEE